MWMFCCHRRTVSSTPDARKTYLSVSNCTIVDRFSKRKGDWPVCRRAISDERIALQRIGFSAILPRRMDANIGYKQRISIEDVEHDKHAQLILVWIEASVSLYSYMKKGAYEKCDDYA